jgi:putative nucleotidyltransferase with HDIG domain
VPIDLSRLEIPPETDIGNCLRTDAGEIPDDMVASVEKVSRLLCARSVILKGITTTRQEPRDLSALVLRDPALAGQILKTVNSAFYGLPHPVASVFKAVLLLGHLEVRNIVWRSCLGEALGVNAGPTGASVDGIWQHSFGTSRVTYALAKSLGLVDPDDLATIALLHDIGKILYIRARPFSGLAVYSSGGYSGPKQLAREIGEIDFCHAGLGSRVVRTWGLPEESCQAIGLHHQPVFSDPSDVSGDRKAIAMLYLADILCNCALSRPDKAEDPIYLPRAGWLELLGLRHGLEPVFDAALVRALSTRASARIIGLDEPDEQDESGRPDRHDRQDDTVKMSQGLETDDSRF